MQHHEVSGRPDRLEDRTDVFGREPFALLDVVGAEQHPEAVGVLPQEFVEVPRRELVAHGHGVGDGPGRSIHRSPHRWSDVGDGEIEVYEDAATLSPCEARREVGGKERRPRASAWPVHGDDPPQRLPFTGAGGEDASGRPCQLAAIGRPQEEPLRSGL